MQTLDVRVWLLALGKRLLGRALPHMKNAGEGAWVATDVSRIEFDLDAYSAWRRQLGSALNGYRTALAAHSLVDGEMLSRLEQLLCSLKDDRLYVAFVAEFSRGKSELINAMFFSQMGQRVLPSRAGRTTMCPTELLRDHERDPYIRLLPIETRSSRTTIAEFKEQDQHWHMIPLELEDPQRFAAALSSITEVKSVTLDEARSMDLPIADDDDNVEGMRVCPDGRVEIPRWRHAIVNLPHPLLDQGLVILDTPGLNAVGAEPELTLDLLSNAHAIVFMLAADTGVTRSDLSLWRDYLSTGASAPDDGTRLVVLNKIDLLWDDLLEPSELEGEVQRQVQGAAAALEVADSRVFPVSAQKALVGRVRGDTGAVERSGVESFEQVLACELVPARHDIRRQALRAETNDILETVDVAIGNRMAYFNDHIRELQGLNVHNVEIVEDMMQKIQNQRDRLAGNIQRFQATRAIFAKQRKKLRQQLSIARLEHLGAEIRRDMTKSLTTGGLRGQMLRFFEGLQGSMNEAELQAAEIMALVQAVYGRLQEENGLARVKLRPFSMKRYQRDMRVLQARHEHFVYTW